VRISVAQRLANEQRIRTVMDRLLRGELPPGGRLDVKTLAREAGVDRTAFYGTRPYAPLREEFEQRLRTLQQTGETPDPRDAQIARLKRELAALRQRLARSDTTIDQLTAFQAQALARLAAQHDEITHLRTAAATAGRVARLPSPAATIGPCS
jgi:DNA-binding GntR family transcriptional regulator